MRNICGGKNLGAGGKIHGVDVTANGREYMICTGRAFNGPAVRYPVDMVDCSRCRKKIEVG